MSRRTKILASAVLAVAAVGGLLQTPLLHTARSAMWSVLVMVSGRWWKIGPLAYDAQYTDQLARLRAENSHLKAELAEYVQLRGQLRQPAVESRRSIQAVVAGAPLDVFRTHLLLNQGVLDGVVVGAPVVTDGSTLIGFISESGEHTAVCRLLFNPHISLPAEVAGVDGARGLVTGNFYTSLMLTTVPRDAQLQEGQTAVTVARDSTPPALVIGTIERVYNEENEAYQQARLRVPYDPDALRAVTILVPP